MSILPQPTPEEERKQALRSRARVWEKDGLISGDARAAIERLTATPWHRVGLILHIVFFVLALNLLGAVYGFCSIIRVPAAFTAGVIGLVAAELLIDVGSVFGAGVESALCIGGLCSLIFALPSSGRVEAILVIALAFALAGWRVLNPLFGGIGFVLVAVYLAEKTRAPWAPALFCAIVTVAAALLLQRKVERRSTEWLLAVLVLVMPLTGYVAAHIGWFWSASTVSRSAIAASLGLMAALLLAVGIAKRGRIELVGGAIAAGCAWFEFVTMLDGYEARLIVSGLALVAIAWVLHGALRGRERGFVVTRTAYSRYDDAMRIAATVALAPQHPAAPSEPQPVSGGGSFGGAGASGDF